MLLFFVCHRPLECCDDDRQTSGRKLNGDFDTVFKHFLISIIAEWTNGHCHSDVNESGGEAINIILDYSIAN